MNDPFPSDERLSPSQTSTVSRKRSLVVLIGVCFVGFFWADLMTPILFQEAFTAMLALSVVTAQLTVICVWGTLVRGTFWIRLPWTLLLLVIAWCGFAWGITIENERRDTDQMLAAAVLWTFGFITSYVPLKIAAMGFRWQIVQESTDDRAGSNSRYAIRDIMIGTLLLALTMGIGRAMLLGEQVDLERAVRASQLHRLEPLAATTIYGIVSLLVKLPCIWISLGEEREKIRSRIATWAVYCFALTVVEIGLLVVIFGSPGGEAHELFLGIMLGHQLMGAIILGVCLALRGLGYRLERSVSGPAADGSGPGS